MANAVFNSYEDYLSKDTSNSVEHNTFDLSHIRSFTTTYGALIPFYLEDCLPSDRFNISNVVKVQSLPMSNPLFNNIKVQTWYFYVPYALLWRKFDLFINGGRDGTYTATIPYVNAYPSPNSLFDYLGFPVAKASYGIGIPMLKVNAFPFAAYQRIYRDYFFNQDLQTTSNYNLWFPEDDDSFSLADGENVYMDKYGSTTVFDLKDFGRGNLPDTQNNVQPMVGFYYSRDSVSADVASKTVPFLNLIRFKNFKRDYFTSAMFSPQRGPAMGLGPTNSSPFTTSDFQSLFSGAQNPTFYDSLWVTNGFAANDFRFQSRDDQLAWSSDNAEAKQLFAKLGNLFAKKISSAITISDIMTASQVQLWMERNMQVKAQYNDFLRIHFGDAPLDERLTKPYYIGGTSQYININAVVQTSESSTTPQGTMTGLGSSHDSQFVGKFTSHEYGLIMGIMCIMPDVYMTDGVDKRWIKESKFDFYFPELAQLPPEPIYNKEIYWDNTNQINFNLGKSVFGYSGRYDLYRHRQNLAVSDLRNPLMSDLSSWIIRRNFSSTPTLNSWDFISTMHTYGGCVSIPAGYTDSNNVRHDYNNIPMHHFPTNNLQNPFIVQVGLKIIASRPLPYRNEPQTLNLRRG